MSTTSKLRQFILEHYALDLDLNPLDGEVDLNFKASTRSGQHYIVKLMHTGCPVGWVDLQCGALQYLEGQAMTIEFPQVIPSQSGEAYSFLPTASGKRILWILSYCEGHLWAHFKPHNLNLLESFGEAVAQLTLGFQGFGHPEMKKKHKWQLTEALQVQEHAQYILGDCKAIAQKVFERFESTVAPRLKKLPYSVIHNDANDYNVLIQVDEKGKAQVCSIFDFGDMAWQPTIGELAIALSYALFNQEHILLACSAFLKGYTQHVAISMTELAVLLDLIKIRLAVSLAISSHGQLSNPDDPYVVISQTPAKALLKRLDQIPDKLAYLTFQQACGHTIPTGSEQVLDFLQNQSFQPIFPNLEDHIVLDLSAGSSLLGAGPENLTVDKMQAKIEAEMAHHQVSYGIGRYAESRRIYNSPLFLGKDAYPTQISRTHHLGVDVFCSAGTAVHAPLQGKVAFTTINNKALDYGGLVILAHAITAGNSFYTMYGHLSHESVRKLEVGQSIVAGEAFARLGAPSENGGWAPHLHLQIILDLMDLGPDFPGVCLEAEAPFWQCLSPNPALLVPELNSEQVVGSCDIEMIKSRRKKRLGGNLSLSYAEPLHIVAGHKQFLYDSKARTYLDMYNNVPHVGHQHPHVVAAVQKQAALLNTNTRYLHEYILQYAERLTAKMPASLEVCYFLNSASEANELALRLARAYTGRKDMLVVEGAYHGHTSSLIDISPYKFDGPGGKGAPDWVHQVPIPDDYRGPFKRGTENVGIRYAATVKEKLEKLEAAGKSVAAFIAETYPSVGGQIMPPADYLKTTYEHLRTHGALCIADEVQTGFGRLGDVWWGFESQEVIPDIVVLGKPIANGFPMGALITTREIANTFDNGMEFFSTFGGNPVACAAANAVLDVLEFDDLPAKAHHLGQQFLKDLRNLQAQHPIIGDVRGQGFFLGIELVQDPISLEPAEAGTRYVVNRLKEEHILAGVDGPLHNVVKIRPSMIAEARDLDRVVEVLGGILKEDFLKR